MGAGQAVQPAAATAGSPVGSPARAAGPGVFGTVGSGVAVTEDGRTVVGITERGGYAAVRRVCGRGDNHLRLSFAGTVLVGVLSTSLPVPHDALPTATRGFKLLRLTDGALFSDGRTRGLVKAWARPDAGSTEVTLRLRGGTMRRGESLLPVLEVRVGRGPGAHMIAEGVAPGSHFLCLCPLVGGRATVLGGEFNGGAGAPPRPPRARVPCTRAPRHAAPVLPSSPSTPVAAPQDEATAEQPALLKTEAAGSRRARE